MKRFITIMFSFLIMLFGGITISSNFAFAEEESLFEIDSAERYVEVLSNDDAYLENAKIVLKNDIPNLNSQDLSRIYSKSRVFKGVFDGNGYTISNINIGGFGGYFGIIPYAEDATIKNLRIQQNVEFDFGDEIFQDVYAGIIVGYGKNVTIKNCELDGSISAQANNEVQAQEETTYTVTIPVKSNIYFGTLAGKLSGKVTSSTQCTSRIYDCINYYNFSLEMAKKGNIYAGGIVGELDNASLERVINFGNISLKGIAISENNTNQYLGGIAGSVAGSKTYIKNSLSGGVNTLSNVSSLNRLYKGGIIGGNPYGTAEVKNFNYDYYMDNTAIPSGDLFITVSEKLCYKDFASHEFLSNKSNFDGAIEAWDFNKTWSLNFHLQNFQIFTYILNNVIDNRGVFAKAYFIYNGQTSEEVNGEQDTGNIVEINAKFDEVVTICLEMKEEYKSWYILKESGVHLNTNSSVSNEITLSEPELGNYNISFNASLLTSGADYKGYYSFTAEAVIYQCSIAVSDVAVTNSQGTYKIDAGKATMVESSIRFSYDKRSTKLIAEGSGHFTFDHWEIWYKDGGDFSKENKYEKNIEESELTIIYGEAPFDKEFKCVAYFTDDKAIKVSFGNVGSGTGIKSIKFSGKEYDGNTVKEILVSPNNSSIPLEVVTNKGYQINVDEFIRDIAELYGDNSTDYTLVEDPHVDEETGETTYNFQLNMRFINAETLENYSLKLSFMVEQDGGGNGKTFLWIYITIPVVVLIVVGVVVFIIIRRRRKMASDDIGGSSSKQKENKPKKESYKDYY